MYRETPDPLLLLVKQRHAELIRKADQYRLARALRDQRGHRPATQFFSGLRLFGGVRRGLERLSAGVRRALSRQDAPCDETCSDCVPC
jgi:hypothetical protein